MIQAMYVDRDSCKVCFAHSLNEASTIFRSIGLSGACKEVGTDKYINY